jgi:two-component sensor histidine kinase
MYRAKLPAYRSLIFVLVIEDNGKGFPRNLILKNPDSLGLELVNLLVEQIEGYFELKKDVKTGFVKWFSNRG